MPEVRRFGTSLSLWSDELRLDLVQEAALARLEHRNPDRAVATYRQRELLWASITAPFLMEDAHV